MARMRYYSLASIILAVGGMELTGRGWWSWQLLGLAVATPPLVWSDLRERRLPNWVLAALAAFELGSLAAQWLDTGSAEVLARAALAAGAVGLIAVMASLVTDGAIGMGDAKLIAVLGLVLGAHSLGVYAAGLLLAFAINTLVAVFVLSRQGRGARFPFGPALLGGAWLAVALATPIELWLASFRSL